MIGILPTLRTEHFESEWMSANPRYQALDEAVFAARREDLELDISGPDHEHLKMFADTIAPESACTSVQLHLQVSPADFAACWNAAQALAGPQMALGANSPFLFGKRLWAETRTELFLQATDTRSIELRNQGVRPPVFFGERWITSIFDLFEENVRYFPALLPETTDENPEEVLAVRQGAAAAGTAAAQRHRLPVEPAGVRRRRRPAAPAGGEPGAAGRAHRRRRAGQRRVLLRRAHRAGRRGPAGVDEDVVRRREGQLRRGRPAGRRRGVLLARLRRGDLGRTAAAAPAAQGRRGAGPVGGRPRRPGIGTWASFGTAARPGATVRGGRSRRWPRSNGAA